MISVSKKLLKRTAVALSMALFASAASFAQSHYESRVFLGGHAGANFSRVVFTPGVTQGFNPGANAGLNFRYVEQKNFGFIVELNWQQRGWKEDFEGKPYNYQRTVNFIQVPFLAHIYFGRRGSSLSMPGRR